MFKKIDKHRQKMMPNILVTNIRSIGQKLDELFCVIRNNNVHIACITETWLNDKTSSDSYVCRPGTLGRLFFNFIYATNNVPKRSDCVRSRSGLLSASHTSVEGVSALLHVSFNCSNLR